MSMLREFREFALKGNVIDLAIAVIIGAAFGKIVDSLVKDIIMPVISRVFGGLDFTNHFIMLAHSAGGLQRTDDLRGVEQGRACRCSPTATSSPSSSISSFSPS